MVSSILLAASVLKFMKMNVYLVLGMLICFLLVIDLYSYKGIKLLLKRRLKALLQLATLFFWSISIAYYVCIAYFILFHKWEQTAGGYSPIFFLTGTFFLFYIPKILFIAFHLIDDIQFIIAWLFKKIKRVTKKKAKPEHSVSRRAFITKIGLVAAAVPFGSFIYGIAKGRFNFQVTHKKIYFEDLPMAFDGIRIVQISDIHIGSFFGYESEVVEAFEMVNELNPDYIFFTGDLVNNYSAEMNGWHPVFKQLHAKNGMYSILGNHDYGDYYKWKNEAEKLADVQNLIRLEQEIGFTMLNNQHVRIEKDNESIVFAGIENWGLPPFRQSGDLNKAMEGVLDTDFVILLSHDPHHWDAQVLGRKNIKLTLSGHTHGMQMGVHFNGKEWSPSKYMYKRWGGLYFEHGQFLYVNRGLGYIGMPARIGMPPEITLLELYRGKE
jgi:predicted MPP superfamily phosphohydrolase